MTNPKITITEIRFTKEELDTPPDEVAKSIEVLYVKIKKESVQLKIFGWIGLICRSYIIYQMISLFQENKTLSIILFLGVIFASKLESDYEFFRAKNISRMGKEMERLNIQLTVNSMREAQGKMPYQQKIKNEEG